MVKVFLCVAEGQEHRLEPLPVGEEGVSPPEWVKPHGSSVHHPTVQFRHGWASGQGDGDVGDSQTAGGRIPGTAGGGLRARHADGTPVS